MRKMALILVLLMGCTKVAPHKLAGDMSSDKVYSDGRVIPKPLGDYACMGDLYVESSTLHSIGLEWPVTGALDQSAQIEVEYRVKGMDLYKPAMNLLRLNRELVGSGCGKGERICNPDAGTNPPGNCWQTENLFAGSIMFLDPDKTYEVRLTATGCKGGDGGSATTTIEVSTKAEPKMATLCSDMSNCVPNDMGIRSTDCGCQFELFPPKWKMPDDATCACAVPSDISKTFAKDSRCGVTPNYQTAMCQHFDNAYRNLQPGDQLLMHSGIYPCFNVYLYKDALQDKPIVIRSAGDGKTVLMFESPRLRGFFGRAFEVHRGNSTDLTGAHWIEGFIIRDVQEAVWSPAPVMNFTFRNNSVRNYDLGIDITNPRSRNIQIMDNAFEGEWPNYGWQKDCKRCATCKPTEYEKCCLDVVNKNCYSKDTDCATTPGKNCTLCKCSCDPNTDPLSGCSYSQDHPLVGVAIAGQGIDVAYNEIHNAEDGLRVNVPNECKDDKKPICCASTDFSKKRASIDFYGNYIHQISDDNEADFGQHNIRFFNNVIIDAQSGLSAQPVYGGPAYFVRNFLYNMTRGEPFKLSNMAAGVYILNNTTVSSYKRNECGQLQDTSLAVFSASISNIHIRNNLFLGIPATSQDGHHYYNIFANLSDNNKSSWDYNAYSLRCCALGTTNSSEICIPDMGMNLCEISVTRPTDGGPQTAKSMKEMKENFGFEEHYLTVDFNDFVNLPPPAGASYIVPYSKLEGIDYHLKGGMPSIRGMGTPIPNITDGYKGKGPDHGAIEGGDPLLSVGPRVPPP